MRILTKLFHKETEGRAAFLMEKEKPSVNITLIEETHLQQDKPYFKEKSSKVKKADQELRKCLGSVGSEETVLKSYSCAWQKDILIQGHLYLTQNWICFYSHILGWETKTSIHLKDVTAISKQRTALVFPNAILIETQDKKYGFASFVHRDHAFHSLQVIWDNFCLQKPSTGEALWNQLHPSKKKLKHSDPLRSKSSSFAEESSDTSSTVLSSSYSPSHSLSKHRLFSSSKSKSLPTDTTDIYQSATSAQSDLDAENSISDQVDSALRTEHQDTDSSDEDDGTSALTQSSDLECSLESDSSSIVVSSSLNNKQLLHRSSSLLTLNPEIEAGALNVSPMVVGGGSPSFLHHWKQTFSVATVLKEVTALARPHHWQICTPTRLINMLIMLFIFLLLLSTVSMVCQLSKVEPSLNPYLVWQPWCSYTGHK